MPRIAAGELLARLAKGKPVPAILLLGDEAYLRNTCRALLIEKYVPESAREWAVSRFSAEDGEVDSALAQAQTHPMLSSQQVVFVEDLEAIENLGDKKRDAAVASLEAYLSNPAPFTTLVLEASGLDQRTRLAKLLSEETLVVAVSLGENEKDRRTAAVVQANRLAADLGVALDAGVAEELADLVADDLLLLKTEIEKLATHAGESGSIRMEDLAALVFSNKKSTVWKLSEMVASQQGREAMDFLYRLLREGEEPVALVGAITWMYRKLIEAQELKGPVNEWQVARQLGMRPDTAAMALESAKRIPREKLLSGIRALQECDDRLKGGSRGARAALDFLIARLAAGNEPVSGRSRLDK
jgi:DNA polymerase-3 subunit delta